MILDDLLRLALAEVWYHKTQSVLILASVAIGIFAIFTLNSVGTGIKEAMFGYLDAFGTDMAYLFPSSQGWAGTGVYFSDADVRKIDALPGVKKVCPMIINIEDIGGKSAWVTGLSMDCYKWWQEKGFFKLERGTLGVALGKILWDELDLDVGESVKIKGQKYRITGLLKPIGNEQDDTSIYMLIEDVEKLYGKDKFYAVIIKFPGDSDTLADIIDNEFKDRNIQLLTSDQMYSQIGSILDTINIAVLGVAFISLLVGGITISNTVYATIKRRTREIGMYKAVGAENNEILTLFIIEATLLSSAGGVFGIGAGYIVARLIAYAVERYVTFAPSTDPLIILGSFAIALFLGPISALLPALYAANLDPTEALRYE